jgi:glutamate-1-semialdehyde 2,1-aminomutase
MKILEREQVVEYLYKQGERLAKGIDDIVAENELGGYFGVDGKPCNLIFYTRDQDRKPSQPFRTLFMQELIKRGVIAPSFVVSYSHSDEDIDRTLEATAEALVVYRKALEEGVDKYLIGRSVQPVMRRFS